MPSDKATMILKKKSSLTAEQISELSEREAWKLIYSMSGSGSHKPKSPKMHTACFTGFNDTEKEGLLKLAISKGISPRTSVSQSLTFLVCGDNAGPSKRQMADAFGVTILSHHEFMLMLETGELPNETSVQIPPLAVGDTPNNIIRFPEKPANES